MYTSEYKYVRVITFFLYDRLMCVVSTLTVRTISTLSLDWSSFQDLWWSVLIDNFFDSYKFGPLFKFYNHFYDNSKIFRG